MRPVVYVLQGMKRSGNHAFINWLLPQLRCAFVNNAIPLGPILRGAPMPLPVPWDEWRRNMPDGSARTWLVTLEDHELSVLPFHIAGIELRRLLIVRNPRQLFSSRIRKASRVDMPAYPSRNDAVMRRATGIWKQHARCYLDADAVYPERVAVSFDAWFARREYRAAICAALGIDFDDTGFGRVSAEGGGSSFDGTAFDGAGQAMNVANRDGQLSAQERDLLEQVFDDGDLRRLEGEIARADPFKLLRPDRGPLSAI